MNKMNPKQRCFRCKGCGAIAGILTEDCEIGPAGSVFHLKPHAHVNKIRVTCRVFQDLEPAEFVAAHDDSPDIEAPRDWEWVGECAS